MPTCRVRLIGIVLAAIALASSAPGQYLKHTDTPLPNYATSGYGITTGPDGNLWIAAGTAGILRMTPAGVFTQFPIPGGLPAYTITTGPDGNLWFEAYYDSVGRITPSGTMTLFSIGSFISQGEMAPGPDGNVWFTKFCDDALYRVTPSGVVTRFPVITPGACATSLTAGPDGNLWFSEHYRNKIGRMTPAGVVTEFRIGPVDSDYPDGIAAGDDGNLYATSNFGIIRRITTDGAISQVSGFYSFGGVVAGGGYLWFGTGAHIGKFSPTLGDFVEFFTLPDTDHSPMGLAYGPDGALWFPEIYTLAVGRLGPASTGFFPLTPCRLVDTRSTEGPALQGGVSRAFQAGGRCGIPAGAVSMAVNITSVAAEADGFLSLAPSGAPEPATSSINYRTGKTRSNNAIVNIGSDGMFGVFCQQATGTSHVVIDVSGYFQ